MLSGELELHFEQDEPTLLRAGESALFSSHRPHAYVAPVGATLLVVLPPSGYVQQKPALP
ncbi:hypothetical protein CFB39_38350 [Burkholderia sp. AU6039]|nr:hypothetical protein CFB39_38350 [Burkholderia sp. AU6039]